MRRLRVALLALGIAPFLGLISYGCGNDLPPIENLCGWLEDPNNCYRQFFEDVGAECGAIGVNSGPQGAFGDRNTLDICVLDQGGQVVFDPPLDLTQFPLGEPRLDLDAGADAGPDSGLLPPNPTGFKIIKKNGDECGTGSITSSQAFSITIDGCPPDAGAPPPLTGSASSSSSSGGGSTLCNDGSGSSSVTINGGSFAIAQAFGSVDFDTTCTSGETHHFSSYTLSKCAASDAALLPTATIITNPGSIGVQGYVQARVTYPPRHIKGTSLLNATPEVVEYFICRIPAAPPRCKDGLKNDQETDVDCGGPDNLDPTNPSCPVRCVAGQKCLVPTDCASGTCKATAGISTCQ